MQVLADLYVLFNDFLHYFVEVANRFLYFFGLDLIDLGEEAEG